MFQKGLERRRNHDGHLQPIEGYVEGMQTEPIGLMFSSRTLLLFDRHGIMTHRLHLHHF